MGGNSLLLLTGGGTRPSPEPEPLVMDTVRQIAGQTMRTGRGSTGRTAGGTYLSRHLVYAPAKDLRLTFGGFLPATVTMPIAAAAVTPDGTRHKVSWGGSVSTVLNGDRSQESDVIPASVSPGDLLDVYTYYGARSDGLVIPGAITWYDAEILPGDQTGNGIARTDPSFRYDGYNGYGGPTPHAITGLTTADQPAVMLLGDSITESGSAGLIRDPVRYPTPRGTYAHRTLEELGIPHANGALWASGYPPGRNGVWGTIPNLSAFTHVITGWGYNDLDQAQQTAKPATTVMAKAIGTWTWISAEGPRVWQPTITPRATSSDGWTSLEGQTPAASTPLRTEFNIWLRDGAPILDNSPAPGTTDPGAKRAGQTGHPLAGVLEIADTISSARDSGIFRVDYGPLTTDGGHPNLTGHQLMAAPVKTWAQAL